MVNLNRLEKTMNFITLNKLDRKSLMPGLSPIYFLITGTSSSPIILRARSSPTSSGYDPPTDE